MADTHCWEGWRRQCSQTWLVGVGISSEGTQFAWSNPHNHGFHFQHVFMSHRRDCAPYCTGGLAAVGDGQQWASMLQVGQAKRQCLGAEVGYMHFQLAVFSICDETFGHSAGASGDFSAGHLAACVSLHPTIPFPHLPPAEMGPGCTCPFVLYNQSVKRLIRVPSVP
jgi:hypothetical protein